MGTSGKKKGLLIALAVLVLVGAAGAAAWRYFSDAGSGPERALPRVEGAYQVLVKTENPKIYKEKLLSLIRLLGRIPNIPALPLSDGQLEVWGRLAEGYANELIGLLDMAEQAAFLAVPGAGGARGRFYLSFIPDERAFDEFVSGSGNLLVTVEKWDGVRGREGWIARPAIPMAEFLGELPALYLLRSGSFGDSPVLVAGSPEGIGEMRKAVSSSGSRVRVTRHNPAPDYIQTHYPVETPSGESRAATTEIAWIEDETSAHAQFHTDAFSLMTGRSVPKSGLRGDDLPFLGSGDLAFVAAADIPYACFAAFPSADDPIAEAMRKFGALLPGQYREDLRKILAEGRISLVVVAEDGTKMDPNTAYLVLESKAMGSISRLLMLPKVLMKSAPLAGWDSCHTTGIQGFNLVLAQRGDVLLLGVGEVADYARTANIPGGIKDFAAPRDLADLVATPPFWNIARPILKERMAKYGLDASLADDPALKPCTVHLRVITPEKADIGFYWGGSE